MRWKVWGSVQGVDRGVRNPIHRMVEWVGRFEDLFKM